MAVAAKHVRIVAADDSAVVRRMMTMLFDSALEHADPAGPRMELCAAVADGVECLRAVRELRPDVVLLDLEMPRMSGMAALDALQREFPRLPVIMCSAHTARGAAETLEALARGAVDYVTKPSGSREPLAAMASLTAQLLPKICALAGRLRKPAASNTSHAPASRAEVARETPEAVVIGVSTGGPAALEQLLPALQPNFAAPVLIAQHMPRLFTRALAERLDRLCGLQVREAYPGAKVCGGEVWIAPGDRHMELTRGLYDALCVTVHDGPPLQHCRPAVDHLFRTAARVCGARALGLMMTGMGSDGLAGARAIVSSGGAVLAQDEASSAVWGMPGRVAAEGLASALLPLESIAAELQSRCGPSAPAVSLTMQKEALRYAMQ